MAKKICPVCGAPQPDRPVISAGACLRCGFSAAYIECFAGMKSFDDGVQKVSTKSRQLIRNLQAKCKSGNIFVLTNEGLAYLSPVSHSVRLFMETGEEKVGDGIRQYSVSERNQVFLRQDGTVLAEGENVYGQLNVSEWKEIRHVCAAPRCIYGLTQKGSIVFAGSVFHPKISEWEGIEKLTSGNYHLVGLKNDGTVCIAGNMLDPAIYETVKSWKDVADIAAAGDCTLALTHQGTVLFAGREDDGRSDVSKWSNITAVAVDSVYAFGLTSDGNILVAGECRNAFLDMGRKDAVFWKNIVAFSCCRSGIAAVEKNGKLHLAGNILGKDNIQKYYNEFVYRTVADELVKSLSI